MSPRDHTVCGVSCCQVAYELLATVQRTVIRGMLESRGLMDPSHPRYPGPVHFHVDMHGSVPMEWYPIYHGRHISASTGKSYEHWACSFPFPQLALSANVFPPRVLYFNLGFLHANAYQNLSAPILPPRLRKRGKLR